MTADINSVDVSACRMGLVLYSTSCINVVAMQSNVTEKWDLLDV